LLLDVAALIELSPRDRRVADNRYRLLKQHLERKGSPLAPQMLVHGVAPEAAATGHPAARVLRAHVWVDMRNLAGII
jgi:hypothetical protein